MKNNIKNLKDTYTHSMDGLFNMVSYNVDSGDVIDVYEDRNVIVDSSKKIIIQAISQPDGLSFINTLKVGDDVGTPSSMTGTPTITFNNTTPATIVRSVGSWIDDGFIDIMSLVITNTLSNNKSVTIQSVTSTTLTLIASDTLINESNVSGVSIIGTASANNPSPPTVNDTLSSMNVINTPTILTPFVIGNNNATSITFTTSIIGTDVMSAYPTQNTKIITSASLLNAGTDSFAYKRFPQKSISNLINIDISWTIEF